MENQDSDNGVFNHSPGTPTLDTVSGFSTCSSPLPPEPFEPFFSIKFTGDVTKDGDIVKYTIKVTKLENNSEDQVILREYADFEWLEHCLLTSNPVQGLIIPPLPSKPSITSEMAEAKSRKQLGSNTKTLIGDDFHKDCRLLEQYLRLLLSHHLFGKDEHLIKFLTLKEAPVRAKVKKGLLSRISGSMESRKGGHKDCEEFFQKERDWVNKYGSSMKEASEAFNSMLFAQQRLCNVVGHLATAFTLSIGGVEPPNKACLRMCTLFSDGLEDIRHGLQICSYNDEYTLGAYLNLYARFIESEKDMLLQRTCLLVDYENSNKNLDKAKPAKREAAENSKLAAERAYEDCSDIARQEIKRFHRKRISLFQEHLEKFAESQLRTSRDVNAMLTKTLTKLKTFQIADVKDPTTNP